MKHSTILRRAVLACLCSLHCSLALADPKPVDVPAGDLATALELFAKQTGTELVFSTDQVSGLRTRGFRGTVPPEEAAAKLIEGTALKLSLDPSGAMLITAPAANRDSPAAASKSSDSSTSSLPAAQESLAEDGLLQELVVTATRVERAGYEAPTPTVAVSAEQIAQSSPANLADFINRLPALSSTTTPRTAAGSAAGGVAGANLLNLRNLGPNRTLVLLDNRRVAASTLTGGVDVNLLPTALVERVDIVTGGASAAWGSDAVAGVVNFVLNTKFDGVKMLAQYGAADEDGGENQRYEVSFGTPFADGRGHFILSGTAERQDPVGAVSSRDWFAGNKVISNPNYTATNGQPLRVILPNVGLASATDGGLITSTALRGTQFNPDGTTSPFNFGFVSGLQSVGGDAIDAGARLQLQGETDNKTMFGHGEYELTDTLRVFVEASYGRSEAQTEAVTFNRFGNLTIRRDNAFLPADIVSQMTALGINSFQLGTINAAIGPLSPYNRRELTRFAGGLSGEVGDSFKWNAYYQRGVTDLLTQVRNNANLANYTLALDAVSSGGNIVCRSTLTAPSNGCVAFNVFGGNASAAAIAYVTGVASQSIELTEDVAAVSFSSEPFSLWAGPVSLAGGVEYRREDYDAIADDTSVANGWFLGNYKPSAGTYDVKEGFVETVVPLLSGLRFADQLDLNGAVRITDYSTSGTVETWKAGLTYDVVDALRLRGTVSRDVRAPNLNDLFQGGTSSTSATIDRVTGVTAPIPNIVIGNTDLEAEKADTVSFGFVIEPLSGLTASVDYYRIKIKDAITTLAAQDMVDRCYRGESALCQYLVRNGVGALTIVYQPALNVAFEKAEGVDFDVRYQRRLALGPLDGMLNLAATGTWVSERIVATSTTQLDYAGQLSDATATPEWRWLFGANYQQGPLSLTLQSRYIGSGKIRNDWTDADLAGNHVPSVAYFDFSTSYGFDMGWNGEAEIFFAVDNITDKEPPVTPSTLNTVHLNFGANPVIYDLVGRTFRGGIRVKF